MSARRRGHAAARLVLGCLVALGTGCAHAPPPEPPVAAAPAPAVNPSARVVSSRRAAGSYALTTDLKTSPAPPRTGGGRRPPPAPVANLRLDARTVATPDATASSSTQLAATVNIPGYTRAPSGRAGQAASWWTLPGDSLVVHFQTPRGDGQMDLRGALQGDTLAGEIWYTSRSSGDVFQLGRFRAVKQKGGS